VNEKSMRFLVGDNPFLGISHLSQERARVRSSEKTVDNAERAAKLVTLSLQNGASGFMFSVSETTLSILKIVNKSYRGTSPSLYAIVPYAYEYVRLATQTGGIAGLAKKIARQIAFSANAKAVGIGIVGLIKADPSAFLKSYLLYEMSRIKSAAGGNANLNSVLLHELITDMALALNLDWLFTSYVEFMLKSKIRPGFETRNFAYLVNKFREWRIDFGKVTIAAPFNKVGFQMNPSRIACEESLGRADGSEVLAISVLAAGYLKPQEAIDYLRILPNITGVVVGVSKERHVEETFNLLRKTLA
jgi:hypothetical protein